ncbi:MAG: hypothetical protein M1839_003048 [Geoglossum umbratile]|nr:MAG: hypothetical protein M1839_003048 [Geoglossum umbratile]
MLEQRFYIYEGVFGGVSAKVSKMINEEQREVSRGITSTINAHMINVNKKRLVKMKVGKGSFRRMKLNMTGGMKPNMAGEVEEVIEAMSSQGASKVREALRGLLTEVEEILTTKPEDVLTMVKHDYIATAGESDLEMDEFMQSQNRCMHGGRPTDN